MGEKSDYVIKNGERTFGHERNVERGKYFLTQGGIYPTELMGVDFMNVFRKISKLNLNEPIIISHKIDIHKTVFSCIVTILNCYMNYKVVDSTYLRQQYLSGEYVDISQEFDSYKVLFITANITDIPHIYNSHCIKMVCDSRRLKGKNTYVFFCGTKEDLFSNRWKLDIESRGINEQNRVLEPLTNYISYFDLNNYYKHKEEIK